MKQFKVSPGLQKLFIIGIAVGVISLVASFIMDPVRAWHGYLISYYFFMMIGLGGIFFAATQHLTNAGWSATVRRIPESFSAWLPWAVLLFIPIVFGGEHMYQWMKPGAFVADPKLAQKAGYLNVPFFIIRAAAFFAVWYFVGGKIVRNSLEQDKTGGVALTQKNIKLSAIFMPLFAILFSAVSFDLLMTLDPYWFSTMFGVNCFANLFLTTMATIVIVVVSLKKAGYFGDEVNENHVQNLGLLMFAFVVFYAYITFCQYMLIWYGNLPEETSYYLRRWEHGWSCYALFIIFMKFILILLPREAKRKYNRVLFMAYWLFIVNWIDIFWMVMPNYSQTPVLPFLEMGIALGFAGAFGLAVTGFLSRHPLEPAKDPRTFEALSLHQ